MEQQAPDPSLVSFLATHDASCPRCGYNLRGVESAVCPECGAGLSLTLAQPRRLAGWGPFLLAVFGWLLLAGTMSTTRNFRSLREQQVAAVQVSARTQQARAVLAAQLARMSQQQPFATLPSDPRFPGLEEMRQFQAQAQRDMSNMMAQQLKSQIASIPAAPPAPTLIQIWQGSGWQTQAGTIWSAAQGLGGLLGLLVLGVMTVRGRGPLWPLVIFACTLSALYVAWHILVFLNEMR
jgi:hypothetical protein